MGGGTVLQRSYWERMANPNVQRVYELLAAYEQGDEEKVRESIDPEGEIYGAPGIVNEGTYRGYQGFRQWIGQWTEAWAEERFELGEIVEVDESVLVMPAHVIARGASSGVEIDNVFGWLYEWRDGRATRFHVYLTVDEAMEAARRLVAERA
jgi:ketosteroid isomerase-like protein